MSFRGSSAIAQQTVFKALIQRGIVVRLFTNNVDLEKGNFVFEEPTDPNYHPTVLDKGWNVDKEQAHHGGVSFRFTKVGEQVHGWFLTDREGNYLGAGKAMDDEGNLTPFSIRVKGDEVLVQPVLMGK